MKRSFALVLALVLCIGLAAGCKNKQAAASTGTSAPGTTQTAGNLTVLVPQGWNLVSDAQQPNQVYICKGGSDLNKNAYVKLTLNSALPAEGICTDVQTLEARTYGSLSWSGFSGTKPAGNAIYMVSDTGILATIWYTQETGALSLEDQSVQAILGGVSGTTSSAQESVEPPIAETASIAGDWSGTLEFMDCSDGYEEKNGLTCQTIARFLADGDGNTTPYIGLAPEGGTISGLTFPVVDEEMSSTLSGFWEGIPFSSCNIILDNGQLILQISIQADTGNALLCFTFKSLTDGSFETLATQLGCTGYPTAG